MTVVAAITWLKLTWTGISSVGVLVTYVLLMIAIGDYRLLKAKSINGIRQYVAKTSIIVFMGGFLTQVAYLVAGITSFSQPLVRNQITKGQYIIETVFIFSSIAATILACVIFARRRNAIEMLSDDDKY